MARPRLNRAATRRTAIVFLSVALGCVAVAGVAIGSVAIGPGQILAIVASKLGLSTDIVFTPVQEAVVVSIRGPRVVAAILVGAALGVSGSALQGLFRNPLADPGLIGLTNGAATGAGIVIVALGESSRVFSAMGPLVQYAVPLAAFAGAALTTLLVYRLSTIDGRACVRTMLLAGIAVTALSGSVLGLLSYISDDTSLRDLTLWMMGSMGAVNWTGVAIMAPAVALATWVLVRRAPALNALLLGEAEARHLGVNVDATKRLVIVLTALAVGVAVAFTGPIGFIGLVVPHVLRLAFGPDNRLVVPGSALLGAMLLVGADIVARTIADPAEVPIGILTSLMGAPLFLSLLLRERRRRWG